MPCMILLKLLYAILALLLALYTVGHAFLLLHYLLARHKSRPIADSMSHYPPVMVQLPLYNEQHVALRLLDAVAALDYPNLQIQILDDSTDITSAMISAHLHRYPHLRIQHLRRTERTGYKAGALAAGLQVNHAEFVAIFDADFIPPADFLKNTLPYLLADERLAFVQSRWGHLNEADNGLTRAQVLAIDTHFLIEQSTRSHLGAFVPFNGTGGLWRRTAIEAAGGWSARTLTEDLDLSFRAQLLGWKALFLPQVVVKGELPPQLSAYRQQQARWAKGSSQCLRLLIGQVWQTDLSLQTRLLATQHLAQYLPQVLMLLLLVLTPMMLLSKSLASLPLAPLGIMGLIPPLMYVVSQQAEGRLGRLVAFPMLLLIGTGLIAANSRAVVQGLWRNGGEFQRTPKFAQAKVQYQGRSTGNTVFFYEWLLCLYALWGLSLAWQTAQTFVPYFALHALAFATVGLWDVWEQWQVSQIQQGLPSNPEATSDLKPKHH